MDVISKSLMAILATLRFVTLMKTKLCKSVGTSTRSNSGGPPGNSA